MVKPAGIPDDRRELHLPSTVNEEVHQFLAVKKAFPETVPLSLGHDELHQASLAGRLIATVQFPGVSLQGHDRVFIPMDDADGYVCLSQAIDPLYRAEFGRPVGKLDSGESIGRRSLFDTRIATPVVHGIDAANPCGPLGMSDRPG